MKYKNHAIWKIYCKSVFNTYHSCQKYVLSHYFEFDFPPCLVYLEKICHLHSGLEVIKARGKGGQLPQSVSLIAEATSPVRSENKEQKLTNSSL